MYFEIKFDPAKLQVARQFLSNQVNDSSGAVSVRKDWIPSDTGSGQDTGVLIELL